MVSLPDDTCLSDFTVGDFLIASQSQMILSVGMPTVARGGRWEHDLQFRDWQDPAREFSAHCSVFGLYDDEQNFLAGVTITQEIKRRSKAEMAVRDSRALVDSLLDRLPLDVGIFDATGRLLHSNAGWRRHGLHKLPAHVRSRSQRWKRLSQASDMSVPEDDGARALRGESISHERHLSVDADQPPRWFRVHSAPLGTDPDSPVGAVVVLQDIDQPKKAAHQLALSDARLSAARDVAGVGTFSFDTSTAVFEWDEKMRSLWGVAAGEQGDWQTFHDHVHPQDASRLRAAIATCMSATRPRKGSAEHRVIGSDGKVLRHVATSCRSIFDGDRMTALVGASVEVHIPSRGDEATGSRDPAAAGAVSRTAAAK